MKVVSGTEKQNYGSKDVILYVFLNVEKVYAHVPKIDLYKTDDGRIVTECPIPASLIEKATKHDPQGSEIYV